jgi:RNA polymerase sigma-70 factor (ECF subfamily)
MDTSCGTTQTTADPEAFVSQAYQELAPALGRHLERLTRDRAQSEDLVQESFVRLLRECRAGRTPDRPEAWLHSVGRRLVIDGVRRHQAQTKSLARLAATIDHEDPEADVLERDLHARLGSALGTLPAPGRQAVVMAAQGYRSAEIGATLDRTEPAVRALVCRSRARLRTVLSLDAPTAIA